MDAEFKPALTFAPLEEPAEALRAAEAVYPALDFFHDAPPPATAGGSRAQAEDDVFQYNAGFDAGKAEAGHVHAATIAVLERSLEQLKAVLPELCAELERDYNAVVTQCLEHLLPRMAEHIQRRQITDIIAECMSRQACETLHATVHPDNDILAGFLADAGGVSVETDTSLTPSAVRFETEDRVSLSDPMATAQACLDVLKSTEAQPPQALNTKVQS